MNLYPEDTPTVAAAAEPPVVTEDAGDGRIVIHDGAHDSGVWIEGEPWGVRR